MTVKYDTDYIAAMHLLHFDILSCKRLLASPASSRLKEYNRERLNTLQYLQRMLRAMN